jgi:hypothetical protein
MAPTRGQHQQQADRMQQEGGQQQQQEQQAPQFTLAGPSQGPSLSPQKRPLHEATSQDAAGPSSTTSTPEGTPGKKPHINSEEPATPTKQTLRSQFRDVHKRPTPATQLFQTSPAATTHQPSDSPAGQPATPASQAVGTQAAKGPIELTPRQKEAIDLALAGYNLFITGSAGAVGVCLCCSGVLHLLHRWQRAQSMCILG